MSRWMYSAFVAAGIAWAGAAAALPGMGTSGDDRIADPVPSNQMPAVLKDVAFEQKLGGTVPLDATFRDETGAAVQLGDLLHGRPAILALVYYECPMLCTLTLNGLAVRARDAEARRRPRLRDRHRELRAQGNAGAGRAPRRRPTCSVTSVRPRRRAGTS
jgi:cytochrome oxidase Cu insertion factor (SCO1/SenC/PrrC family)